VYNWDRTVYVTASNLKILSAYNKIYWSRSSVATYKNGEAEIAKSL